MDLLRLLSLLMQSGQKDWPASQWKRDYKYTDTPQGAAMPDQNGVLSQMYNGQGFSNQFDLLRHLLGPDRPEHLEIGDKPYHPDNIQIGNNNQSFTARQWLNQNPGLMDFLEKMDERDALKRSPWGQPAQNTQIDPLTPPRRPTWTM